MLLPRDAHEYPRLMYVMSLLAIAGGVALLLVMGLESCSSQRAARRGARVGCLERLANARACEALVDANHEACYRLTYQPGSRYRRTTFDANGYLECVLDSPERFEAAREQQREQHRRDREAAQRELGLP